MIIRQYILICALGITVTACSGSSDNQQTAAPQTAAPQTMAPAAQPGMQQGAVMPEGHPAIQQGTAMPGHTELSQSQMAAIAAAKSIPKQGTVLDMMHAAGYTYMQVDTGDGKPLWIAATMMRVKPQQKVQWGDAAMMTNFTSKTLHRTFDKILFVSNAQVIE
jgi:hypothetical protein